jgi:hypothetical protein
MKSAPEPVDRASIARTAVAKPRPSRGGHLSHNGLHSQREASDALR